MKRISAALLVLLLAACSGGSSRTATLSDGVSRDAPATDLPTTEAPTTTRLTGTPCEIAFAKAAKKWDKKTGDSNARTVLKDTVTACGTLPEWVKAKDAAG